MSEELPREVALRILSLHGDDETWKAFAERHGLTPQVVSNWRNQGEGASLDAAAKVLKNHRPRLSPAWLLVGLPPRYLPEGMELEEAVQEELGELAVRLDVIGMVYNEQVDALALKRFAEEILGLERADARARAETVAHARGVTPPPVEPEETDEPDGDGPPGDRPRDGTND